jgi:SHS2 domain-containing protein
MFPNNPKNYHEIEHTADVGIYATGTSLSEVFANAAFAMRHILYGHIEVTRKRSLKIKLVESNLSELMVRWLSELNFQLSVKNFLISTIEELRIDTKNAPYHLYAHLQGDSSQAYLTHLNNEIKAVTYHQLKIEESQGKFFTQVIFDI